MKDLINRNQIYFKELNYSNINIEQKNNFLNILRRNKKIIVKGNPNTNKVEFISYILNKSNLKNQYLYLNKILDLDNIIKSGNFIEFILLHLNKNIKIIILENFELVHDLENFIQYIEKNNIRIIFISNKLKFKNFIEFEIIENKNIVFDNRKHIDKQINTLKKEYIINQNIIKKYKLKSDIMYNYTLILLSKTNTNLSIRKINRELNKNIKISLITMMEYLNFSIQEKIIYQIQAFDFKRKKEIETKTKFYFFDTNFRNSLYNFELSKLLLKQNFLFNKLNILLYKINSGINGSYEFDFYGIKKNGNKINIIYIDFGKSKEKKEIKKQINKLLKVPEQIIKSKESIIQTFSKYLILENPSELGIKKLQYENLKIVSFDEILKLI